jgi:hypothetical protein
MAKLVCVKREDNPDNDDGACVFGYFEGRPTRKELRAATEAHDGYTVPCLVDDEVSTRAGLQRWLLTQAV